MLAFSTERKCFAATKRYALFISSQLVKFCICLCVYISFVSLIKTQARVLEAFLPVMY